MDIETVTYLSPGILKKASIYLSSSFSSLLFFPNVIFVWLVPSTKFLDKPSLANLRNPPYI